MRLGIFGGSFDPPHIGHYLAAADAAEQLALDTVLWIPASQQPLKAGTPHQADAEQRFAMVSAAVAGASIFSLSRIEINRSGLSYMVTTIESLRRVHPDDECFLLVGQDAWNTFSSWHEPERIQTLTQIAVLARPAERVSGRYDESDKSDRLERSHDRSGQHYTPDRWLDTRLIQVSSTEIRARVRAGKSIRGFVNDGVAAIIESEGLYRW